MKFQLLKQEFKGVQVPKIVFENLKTARETDLKVILYVLNSNVTDPVVISRELNLNMISVQSSLLFWTDAGLLLCLDKDEELKKIKKVKLTSQDIIKIKETVPEISILIKQIQVIFGSTLNEKSIIKFVELFLEENIPIDAIITLSYYYNTIYKQNPNYIVKVVSSANKKHKFSSGEKAEEYIELIENREKQQKEIANLFNCSSDSFNTAEKTIINSWYEKLNFSFDMIEKSFEVAGSNADIKYCNGILKNWNRKKYKNISDLEKEVLNSNGFDKQTIIKPEDDLLLKAALTVPTFLEGE